MTVSRATRVDVRENRTVRTGERPIPLISIILPTYQRATLLPRSIGSVLSQTFHDWELVVVDDGSTDNTADVVAGWQQHCERIRYLHQPNRGVGAARNRGIAAAGGEYIACLDSDDEYRPTHLETRLALVRRHHLDLIQGGVVTQKKQWVVDFFHPAKLIRISECVIGGTLFGKRTVFLALGGFGDLNYGEDLDLWLRAKKTFKAETFREPATYILHETPNSLRMARFDEWAAMNTPRVFA